MGHSGKDLQRYILTLDQIFEEYKKAIQFLTIDLSPELGNKIQELNQEKNEMTIMDMKHKQTVDLSDTLEFITLCIISSLSGAIMIGLIVPLFLIRI